MKEHQIHFDRKFYHDKKSGYWISTDYPRIRAHQWIWIKVHGLIPKGYHIHHKNENKSDNIIENLELISSSKHLSHHMQNPMRKQKAREMADKYRPLAKQWHSSEEGRSWHRIHAIVSWLKRTETSKKCNHCGQEFSTKTTHQIFCSNKCKSSSRRKEGVDNIDKKCFICQSTFTVNKYCKTSTCSRKCAATSAIKTKSKITP